MKHSFTVKKIVNALAWDSASTLASQLLNLAITIILARLLTPEEFGSVAIILVLINILTAFTDVGLQSGLIQRNEFDQILYSSVFFTNIILSFALFIVIQVFASPFCHFYGISNLIPAVKIASIMLFFNALSSVYIAILKINLDFKVLAIRIIVSRLFGGIFGILLAFHDYGIYALVWQEIVGGCINFLLLWQMTKWRPSLNFSLDGIKNIFSFSSYIFLSQIFNRIVNRADTLLIGKAFSPALLGYYGRAQSLNNLVQVYSSKSLNSVLFPVLSSLKSESEFKFLFYQLYSIVSFLAFYFTGVLIIASEILILTLFGAQWIKSIEMFHILAFKTYSFPVNSVLICSLIARGKSKENFKYGLIRGSAKLICYSISMYYSFTVFLIVVVLFSFVGTIFNNIIISKKLKLSFKHQFRELIVVSLILFLALGTTLYWIPKGEELLLRTIGQTLVFTGIYFSTYIIINRKKVKNIFKQLKKLLKIEKT